MLTEIGWFHAILEGSSAFLPPKKVVLERDPSRTRSGHLSCPAVRSVAQGCYAILSPFSLTLRFTRRDKVISITPIYPSTSVSEGRLRDMLRLEPRESWYSDDRPIIQIASPYTFVADQKVEVEKIHPVLGHPTRINWRVIPGRFDIYGWQRPLNWAFEWDALGGDLSIRMGEPLYYVKFFGETGSQIFNPDLFKIEPSERLKKRMVEFSGVSGLRRSTQKLIKEYSDKREGGANP